MIEYGSFLGHSGLMLPFKVNCDALTDEDWAGLAQIVRAQFSFSHVMGIPRGGLKFATALRPYCSAGPLLLVDDVMTTGRSMEEYRAFHPTMPTKGVVVFSRGPVPDWVHPIFVVSPWTQAGAISARSQIQMSDQTSPTEKEVYTVEVSHRRCEVMEQALGHFRIYFGQDGEWLNSYRVTNDLKKAKSWADDWVSGVTDVPNLMEEIGNK